MRRGRVTPKKPVLPPALEMTLPFIFESEGEISVVQIVYWKARKFIQELQKQLGIVIPRDHVQVDIGKSYPDHHTAYTVLRIDVPYQPGQAARIEEIHATILEQQTELVNAISSSGSSEDFDPFLDSDDLS